jgi:hypothetical protein
MPNTAGNADGSPQGGQQAWDAAANTQPIPPSNAGTTAANTAGTAYATPSTEFGKIVTSLIVRNVMQALRTKAVILQGGAFVRARNVPGTKDFVYTVFADLGPAEELLEGVPPETTKLLWDQFSFSGKQKGKVVAITDLADLMSPFDLYSQAAEKVAWNAIDTAETDAVAAITGAEKGVAVTTAAGKAAENVVTAVTTLKVAEVPTFGDGFYYCYINPADSAVLMTQTGELGWTDAMKYAGSTALLNGEIGRFRGVRFIETNRVPAHKSVIFGPEYVAWGDYQTIQAYRVAPGGDHADPLAQRGLVGWKGMWGVKPVSFSGTPAVGPATNTKGYRFAQVDLTATA